MGQHYTRYDRLTKQGWKVIHVMNKPTGMEGSVHGVKGNRRLRATSVTNLHKQINGY